MNPVLPYPFVLVDALDGLVIRLEENNHLFAKFKTLATPRPLDDRFLAFGCGQFFGRLRHFVVPVRVPVPDLYESVPDCPQLFRVRDREALCFHHLVGEGTSLITAKGSVDIKN